MPTPRPHATPEEARRVIDALIARSFAGELPPLSSEPTILDWRAHLSRLPPAAVLPLHGRALFAAASLTPEAREHAACAREDFFAELAAPFGMSARALHGAVRARTFPLVPPRTIPDHEYLGRFTSDGTLDIADPCHLRKQGRLPTVFSLTHTAEAHAGHWHVYVSAGGSEDDRRTAELVVIHDLGFDLAATEFIGNIAVDAGMAGVFDRECPQPDLSELRLEGVVHGRGAFARSGWGDGIYPILVGRTQARVAKLRLPFLDDEHPEVDATLPRRPSRRYAASATFAVGDTIEHVKFGAGTVIFAADGKIEVQFEDDTRTLVHGRR